jgi:uncharacterized protein (TIGR02646 family)
MVKFNRNQTPLELVDNTRQVAFRRDKEAQRYVDENSLYKCKYMRDGVNYYPVRDILKKIYRNKCAYCETKFTRAYINIEHYRPKANYYFLAYSWSNLLPICQVCNTQKSNHFELSDENLRLKYNNETLQEVQYKTEHYNLIEKPLFIHPDIDDYKNLFYFNTKGKMLINTKHIDKERIEYTIQTSNLNEQDLLNRRGEVFEEFRNMKIELLHLFQSAKKHKDREEMNYFKQETKKEINIFFKDTKEFLAVRKQIIKRLHLFLLCVDKDFIRFFEAYILRYTEKIEVYNCD